MRTVIFIWILGAVMLKAAEPLSLSDAVTRAVATHPSVEAARAGFRAASEKLPEAKAGYKPRVEFQESWMRSNNPVFVFGSLLTQRQFGAQNFAIESLNRPDALNQFQSLVVAEQMLWDGGRTRRSVEVADLGRREAAVSVRQMELALASRTARAYLEAQLTQAAIPVAQQALASAEADLKQAEAMRDAGRTTEADALSVKVHRAAVSEQLAMRRAEARIAQCVLNELIGAPTDSEFELTTAMKVAAIAEVSATRPEVDQALLQVETARKQGELARLARMPQVGLRIGFEADRQRFVNRGGANWMAGVSLKWNLYQGGAEGARIRAAGESEKAAQWNRKAVEQRVQVEVMEASTLFESSQARVETARSAILAAEESLRIVRDRYEAGLETITSLLRTETAVMETRLRLLIAEHGVRMARLNQEAALGRLGPDSEVLR